MSNPTTLPLAQRITQGPVSKGMSRPYRIACVRPEYLAVPRYYVSAGEHTGGNGWPAGIHKTYTENADEWEANAELIAEAFNVTHETQRTPRQLADERAELIYLLSRINDGFWLEPKNGALGAANAMRTELVETLTRLTP